MGPVAISMIDTWEICWVWNYFRQFKSYLKPGGNQMQSLKGIHTSKKTYFRHIKIANIAVRKIADIVHIGIAVKFY